MNRIWMSVAAAAAMITAGVVGCTAPTGVNAGGNSNTGGNATGGNGSGNSGNTGNTGGHGTIGGDSGLPCDVADFLSQYCISCHGNPPTSSAPMSLLTYAELTAPSKSDASKSNAQLSMDRVLDAAAPMPPGVHLTAAQYGAFQSWVSAGTPMGNCGMIDAGPPDTTFTDPAAGTCDGTVHAKTCQESKSMNPGMACIGCHDNPSQYGCFDNGPAFALAGTVFARGHVADGCRTDSAQNLAAATVVITDKNGKETTLPVNSAGNFYWETFQYGALAKPYTARVEFNGKVRAMSAAQTDGDCNTCHTAAGTSNAPGRIALPQ